MNTALLVLIVLLVAAAYATFATIHADRPRTTPRSHATDPAFEPVVRWP
ncbi:hypothetical protein [Nocardioides albus]|uniref:Uncharacterized protein n=1 Tax=Nocardioides albus TaxID=1841 RepID=A0A7W5F8P5_9ACTN|nr:hypothetical protein [Nocardioides albus]MBB3089291.1 hypothetical protein [Nocardioides albus]